MQLLDAVDNGDSALVVAPTGSGKTFISYYAMEKVLRADDESVIAYAGFRQGFSCIMCKERCIRYVSPTKALVNQVYHEVEARFSKK